MVEQHVKATFGKLKLVYARGGQDDGHLAFSSLRLNQEVFDALTAPHSATIQEHTVTFTKSEDENLKDFWNDHGNHYSFCTANKVRVARKNQKLEMAAKKETVKRAKTQYEIAGVIYIDIGKVKSKARSILHLKNDGEALTDKDEAFMKDIIQFHERTDEKMKDFEHFEVGNHPDFDKTRCFFVVRKDGTKTDFSVTKCINALENA